MTLLLNKPSGLDGSLTLTDGTVEGCGFLLGKLTSPSRAEPRPQLGVRYLGGPMAVHRGA
jgi:hypothetical protein